MNPTTVFLLCKVANNDSDTLNHHYKVLEAFQDEDVAWVTCEMMNAQNMQQRVEYHMSVLNKSRTHAMSDYALYEGAPHFVEEIPITYSSNWNDSYQRSVSILQSHYFE